MTAKVIELAEKSSKKMGKIGRSIVKAKIIKDSQEIASKNKKSLLATFIAPAGFILGPALFIIYLYRKKMQKKEDISK